jgi:hypothetical protein
MKRKNFSEAVVAGTSGCREIKGSGSGAKQSLDSVEEGSLGV